MKAQGRVRVAGWRPLMVTTSHALVSYELTGQKLDHPFRPYGVPGPELGVWSPEESGVAAPACLGSRTRFGTKTEPTGLAPEDLYVRTQCAPPQPLCTCIHVKTISSSGPASPVSPAKKTQCKTNSGKYHITTWSEPVGVCLEVSN